ncbi:MAG: hypothetical protein IKN20_00965 [Firmicutes bacterium]|nr:hypothetical protein [Bacillota bacterium]
MLKNRDLANPALGKLTSLWKTFGLTRAKKCAKPCIARLKAVFGFPQALGEKVEKSLPDRCRKSPESLKISSGEKVWKKSCKQQAIGLHNAFWAGQK